jgi:transposase-like protein
MADPTKVPETLMGVIRHFSDPDVCIAFVAILRWPDGPECPRCASKEYSYLTTRRVWKCKACSKQYSVKVGTIFEDSPLPLDKWLCAMWMLANCKNGISSYEVARDLGITQKSAWFMLQRLRVSMQNGTFRKLEGVVEVDETYIGGKARNMHASKRKKMGITRGRSANNGKTVVFGLLERHGDVRCKVITDVKRPTLQGEIKGNVEVGSNVYTDDFTSYYGLNAEEYAHEVINHAEKYVDGQVHTNGIENFWSCLKRTIGGTYVSVEPFHLFRYLDEQMYRYNNRTVTDADRFLGALYNISGRRLTWNQLTAKGGEPSAANENENPEQASGKDAGNENGNGGNPEERA